MLRAARYTPTLELVKVSRFVQKSTGTYFMAPAVPILQRFAIGQAISEIQDIKGADFEGKIPCYVL